MYGANFASIPPGVVGKACLEAVRVQIQGSGHQNHTDIDKYLRSDQMIVRFLIARQWDVPKATEMLLAHYKWREEKNIEALVEDPFPEAVAMKTYYPHGYHGTDKLGRPLYIEQPGRIDMTRLCQHVGAERLLDYMIAGNEVTLRRRLPACSLAQGEVIDKSVQIIDLDGLGLSMVSHSFTRRVLKDITKIAQDHYPESMGRMIIINAPRIFSLIWSFVKPLLDEKSVSKISIYGTDKAAYSLALLEMVDADQLPKMYGGNCVCNGTDPMSCMHQEKGPWIDPDIVRILDSQPLSYLTSIDGVKLLERIHARHGGTVPEVIPSALDLSMNATEGESESNDEVEQAVQDASDEENVEGLPVLLPSFSSSAPLKFDQAQETVEELTEQYRKLEEAYMTTSENWLRERNQFVQTIGHHAIERAQGYYDGLAVWNQAVQACARQQDEVDTLVRLFDNAVKDLSRSEVAFEAFCSGVGSDLTDEEWENLVPPDESNAQDGCSLVCEKQFPQDGCALVCENPKLLRAYRLSLLADRVTASQQRRDAATVTAQVKSRELDDARIRVENEQKLHCGCGASCSLKRAAPFYERHMENFAIMNALHVKMELIEDEINTLLPPVTHIQLG